MLGGLLGSCGEGSTFARVDFAFVWFSLSSGQTVLQFLQRH